MTALVALLCKNGAVLGADQSMSSTEGGLHLCETPTNKIRVFENGWGALACAGKVGAGQVAFELLKSLPRAHLAKKLTPVGVLQGVQSTLSKAPMAQAEILKLIGHSFTPEGLTKCSRETVGDGIYLQTVGEGEHIRPVVIVYEGSCTAVVLEEGKVIFSTLGSGSLMAQPYMSVIQGLLFPNRLPTMEEGMLAVYWTLRHVIEYRTGGGVGGVPDLALLEFDGEKRPKVRMAEQELNERISQMFDDLNAATRAAFAAITTGAPPTLADAPPAAPAVPAPPAAGGTAAA